VWLFPARPHRLVAQSADFSMWVLVVRRSAHARWRRVLEPAARRDLAADDPALAPCRHLADGDASDLHHALRALAGLTAWPGAFRAALDFAVVLAWRAYQRAPADGRPLHPAVQRALAALRAQPTLDGAALAAHAGMSRARLSGRFRAETGESLVDCRNRLRIERILAAPPRSGGLLAAALAAGFGSYAQFHRAFRRATGSSPRAWLARQPQPHYL
jgi:AraC-like DNA-binding protein